LKARQCTGCAHLYFSFKRGITIYCGKGHKPRFYQPRNELDQDWGWKRRCSDFLPSYEPLPKEEWEDEYLGDPTSFRKEVRQDGQ